MHLPLTSMIALVLTGFAMVCPAAAEDQPLQHTLGTKHRFVQPDGSPYPAAGCNDHRTLMFIVREVEGEDPGAAKLLVQRDCRPLVEGAEYIRCGPGGWAYPAKGERLSYASYCRVGAKDVALYALDQQMKDISEGVRPAR